MAFIDTIRKTLLTQNDPRPTMRELLKREAKIGGQVFGPIQAGNRREFFCLDDHTWVWYEEWVNENGQRQAVTTRYEITKRGILKAQDGTQYQFVQTHEADRLMNAIRSYYQLVSKHVYGVIA